jgi:hypothetical protein
MKRLLLVLSFIVVTPAFASECKVSFVQKNGATSLSDEAVEALEYSFEQSLIFESGIVIVSPEEAEFHIETRLRNWTDHHDQNLHNAFVSLSLFAGAEQKMFSYSHHLGKSKRRLSKAGSWKNFDRAYRSALKAIRSCDNLRRLDRL